MPRPNPITPEVEAAFLAELRSGTLVVAAAARVGVAVQTLYRRRGRDARFRREWGVAAAASFGWAWRKRNSPRWERRWSRVATARRLRFAGERRSDYLEALEREGDPAAAARAIEVDPRTVRSALRRDPDFARAHASALERGRGLRERRAAAERARHKARMLQVVERTSAALERPANGRERHFRRIMAGWRPDRPGVWRAAPPGRTPAEAIAELSRKIRRIEFAPGRRAIERRLAGTGWSRGSGGP